MSENSGHKHAREKMADKGRPFPPPRPGPTPLGSIGINKEDKIPNYIIFIGLLFLSPFILLVVLLLLY